MATWKKVIVSGSEAHLKSIGLGTAAPTAIEGEISASGKLYASSSQAPGAGTYNIVVQSTTGGEFMFTSSAAINPAISTLTAGDNIAASNGNYDGNADTTFSVNTASLAGNGLTVGTNTLVVQANSTADNILVDTNGVSVKTSSLADTARGITADLEAGKLSARVDGSTIGFNGSGQLTASRQAGDPLTVSTGLFIDLSTVTSYTGQTDRKISVDTGSLAGEGLSATDTTDKISIKGHSSLDGSLLKYNTTSDSFINSNITDASNVVTLGNASTDVTISGNLTVTGTASFQNETNLRIADDFVLFASGSPGATDFGIVGQQGNGTNDGIGWIFDSSADRFMMVSGSNIDNGGDEGGFVGYASLMVGDDETDTSTTYGDKDGNMVVTSGGDIFIYS